VTVRCTGL